MNWFSIDDGLLIGQGWKRCFYLPARTRIDVSGVVPYQMFAEENLHNSLGQKGGPKMMLGNENAELRDDGGWQ